MHMYVYTRRGCQIAYQPHTAGIIMFPSNNNYYWSARWSCVPCDIKGIHDKEVHFMEEYEYIAAIIIY